MTASTKHLAMCRRRTKPPAVRFIHGFNDDDWETVREIVAPGFVFHHPLGGTLKAGPDGMVSTWAGFKVLSPDSWHPIPVMIAEGDFVAVLLPTYGHFSGQGEHAPPPTGGRLDYGMVNMVRLEGRSLVEMWFRHGSPRGNAATGRRATDPHPGAHADGRGELQHIPSNSQRRRHRVRQRGRV